MGDGASERTEFDTAIKACGHVSEVLSRVNPPGVDILDRQGRFPSHDELIALSEEEG